MEGSTLRGKEKNEMSNRKVIQLTIVEENFLTISSGMFTYFKDFFTKVPNQVFPNLVREFQSNIKIEDLSLKSFVRGLELKFIDINSEGYLNYTSIVCFVMNPMEDKKLSIENYLKEKISRTHI